MQATSPDETAIVLVHGFGAGVFAWRNVMQPLADTAGCRVIAFDRPAFGRFFSSLFEHTAKRNTICFLGSLCHFVSMSGCIHHICVA